MARVRKSKTELPGEKACHHVASAPGLHCHELELKALFAARVGGERVETGQDPTPFVTRVWLDRVPVGTVGWIAGYHGRVT